MDARAQNMKQGCLSTCICKWIECYMAHLHSTQWKMALVFFSYGVSCSSSKIQEPSFVCVSSYKPNNSIAPSKTLILNGARLSFGQDYNYCSNGVYIIRSQWWALRRSSSVPQSMAGQTVWLWWTWRSYSRWCCRLHLRRTRSREGPLHMLLPAHTHHNNNYINSLLEQYMYLLSVLQK